LAQQIVALLKDEGSGTQHRAIQAAAMLLGDKVPLHSDNQAEFLVSDPNQLAIFFNREGKQKPSDFAHLCAAYHFSQYGTSAFSLDDLRTIASDAGVVLPDRLDMTLKKAGKDGKKLFQISGRNSYKPTASAGVFFYEKWQVRPGSKTKELGKNA
jgi:hypothetical protein